MARSPHGSLRQRTGEGTADLREAQALLDSTPHEAMSLVRNEAGRLPLPSV
jgi:hypothetical protein